MQYSYISHLESIAKQLHCAELATCSDQSISGLIDEFVDTYVPAIINRDIDQIWYRARKCENNVPFSNLNEMIYISTGCAKYGRAQFAGSSVLYAGWNQIVALDEIGAQTGDLVQIITLRPIQNFQIQCHVIGEYEGFFNSGRSPLGTQLLHDRMMKMQKYDGQEFTKNTYIDSVMADFFRKQVNESYEHKITAAYAEHFHKKEAGFIYPSVKNVRSFNLAINAELFDSYFEVLVTNVFEVTRSFGHGVYNLNPRGESHEFADDGTIDWNSEKRRNFSRDPQVGRREVVYTPGWRKPKADVG